MPTSDVQVALKPPMIAAGFGYLYPPDWPVVTRDQLHKVVVGTNTHDGSIIV